MQTKKHLGQHWLYDKLSLNAIAKAANITVNDVILEIGPGTGSLTKLLSSQSARVIAVEKDRDLIEPLRELKLANVEIVQQDILTYNFSALPSGYKVVANIPYYLTSALLRNLYESKNPPRLMSLLVQKELAERVCAKPGAMSVLAVSVQYFATAAITSIISRHKFIPPPKVDSAVIQLITRDKPYFTANTKDFFRLVKAGFGERRKQLKNSLAGGLRINTNQAELLVVAAELGANVRAQELSLKQWHQLYEQANAQNLL